MNNNILDVSWGKICDGQVFSSLPKEDILKIEEMQHTQILAIFRRKVFHKDSSSYKVFLDKGYMVLSKSRHFPDVFMNSIRRASLTNFISNNINSYDLHYAIPRDGFSYNKFDVFRFLIDQSYSKGCIREDTKDSLVRSLEVARTLERMNN